MDTEKKNEKISLCYEMVESNLTLIGATIVEDKLQENVPEVIKDLRLSGIKIWMLTGDKLSTAYNIGLSCNLISKDMKVFKIEGKNVKKNENLEDINKEERIQTIDYRVQTITVSYTLPDDCILRVHHQPTWVSECTINPSTKKISITVDEVSEPKQGTVEFEVEGRHCTAQNKAIGIERKENECKFPGDTIQIMLTELNSSYEYYVLTDQVIGVNCTEWIKSNGHKYYPTNSGIRSLGYYQYQACTLTQYDSGENYYCSITTPGSATCNGSNSSLSSNTTYHLYGFTGTNFSEIRSIRMPDGDTAQSGANSEKQYIV
jgi:hypothetical protein